MDEADKDIDALIAFVYEKHRALLPLLFTVALADAEKDDQDWAVQDQAESAFKDALYAIASSTRTTRASVTSVLKARLEAERDRQGS